MTEYIKNDCHFHDDSRSAYVYMHRGLRMLFGAKDNELSVLSMLANQMFIFAMPRRTQSTTSGSRILLRLNFFCLLTVNSQLVQFFTEFVLFWLGLITWFLKFIIA
mgnify:CR=1 FL=1